MADVFGLGKHHPVDPNVSSAGEDAHVGEGRSRYSRCNGSKVLSVSAPFDREAGGANLVPGENHIVACRADIHEGQDRRDGLLESDDARLIDPESLAAAKLLRLRTEASKGRQSLPRLLEWEQQPDRLFFRPGKKILGRLEWLPRSLK